MKSLERRFNNIAQQNPYWSSYICFAEAVRKQNFSKKIIMKYFNGLVEKEDYDKADKKEIIKHLLSLSSNPEKITDEGMF